MNKSIKPTGFYRCKDTGEYVKIVGYYADENYESYRLIHATGKETVHAAPSGSFLKNYVKEEEFNG